MKIIDHKFYLMVMFLDILIQTSALTRIQFKFESGNILQGNNQTLRSKIKMGLISNGTTIFDAGSMASGFNGSMTFIKK